MAMEVQQPLSTTCCRSLYNTVSKCCQDPLSAACKHTFVCKAFMLKCDPKVTCMMYSMHAWHDAPTMRGRANLQGNLVGLGDPSQDLDDSLGARSWLWPSKGITVLKLLSGDLPCRAPGMQMLQQLHADCSSTVQLLLTQQAVRQEHGFDVVPQHLRCCLLTLLHSLGCWWVFLLLLCGCGGWCSCRLLTSSSFCSRCCRRCSGRCC